MEFLNSNTYLSEKPFNHTFNINPYNSKNISDVKTAYTSFQNTNQNNKLLSSFDKYKNQQILNSAQIRNQRCHNCHPHHFHVHHIHIPQERLFEALNLKNINYTSDLMKEVLDLKNECRKFREELEINNNERNAGNKYIRELENNLYQKNKNNDENENEKENDFNIYHDMLDKSLEVLNSVSKKSDDKNAKAKGGIYYYKDKNNEYNKLIEAQKNWIDNLPEKIGNPSDKQINDNKYYNNNKLNNSSNSNNKNLLIPSYNYGFNEQNDLNSNNNFDKNIFEPELSDNKNELNNVKNPNKNKSKYVFDSKKNNNKGYIIKKGEKIIYDSKEDDENDIFKNNYNTDPNINNKNKFIPNNNLNNQSNNNYNSFPQNQNNIQNENNNDNNLDEKDNNNINLNEKNDNEIINLDKEENEENKEIDNLINNNKDDKKELDDNIINDKEREKNPFNERYLIVDKNGKPILVNDQKILGMEIMPFIGEDGKEMTDENGNIILIGPNGQSKTQDELEPIILDNDKLLVNEENKPVLGLDGVALINIEGNLIAGPDELFDNDNKKIEGIIGFVAKDSEGNPIKNNISDNNNDSMNNNNKPESNNDNMNNKNKPDNNNDNMNNNIKPDKNSKDFSNLKPLIDIDGKPILDSNNNFIILDKNNKPIRNKGICVLLDKNGKSILDEEGNPILFEKDENENPINIDINNIDDNNNRIRNKKMKPKRNKKVINPITYSECNPESLKKINFIRPYKNHFYDDIEYKGTCFACDLGCSVSKSGYSCMNYSPYNNRIKRRNITPIKVINGFGKKNRKFTRKAAIKKSKKNYLS